jgi:hypothetical protein
MGTATATAPAGKPNRRVRRAVSVSAHGTRRENVDVQKLATALMLLLDQRHSELKLEMRDKLKKQ